MYKEGAKEGKGVEWEWGVGSQTQEAPKVNSIANMVT